MKPGNKTVGPRLRIVLDPGVALGPGKVDLLAGIEATGSIAAAGRRLGMSYKRAWSLVEEMNADFGSPVARTSKGGKTYGGADLTETGKAILTLYRRMEAQAAAAIEDDMVALRALKAAASD